MITEKNLGMKMTGIPITGMKNGTSPHGLMKNGEMIRGNGMTLGVVPTGMGMNGPGPRGRWTSKAASTQYTRKTHS